MKSSGIYNLRCTANGFSYIGEANDLMNRKYKHFSLLKKNGHPCKLLQDDFNEFGIKEFVFEVLEIISDKNERIFKECELINKTIKRYNSNTEIKLVNGRYQYSHSNETKANMSKSAQLVDLEVRRSGKSKINKEIAYKIKLDLAKGMYYTDIANMYNISPVTVSSIFLNKRWSDVICSELDEFKKNYDIKKKTKGLNNSKAKLTEQQVLEIYKLKALKISNVSICKVYPICSTTILNMKKKNWFDIDVSMKVDLTEALLKIKS